MDRYVIVCSDSDSIAGVTDLFAGALTEGLRHPSGFSFEPLAATDARKLAEAAADAIQHTSWGGCRMIGLIDDARDEGGSVQLMPSLTEQPDGSLEFRTISNRRGDSFSPVRLHCADCGRDIPAIANTTVGAVIDLLEQAGVLGTLGTVEYPLRGRGAAGEDLDGLIDLAFGAWMAKQDASGLAEWLSNRVAIPFSLVCAATSRLSKDR